MDNSGDIPRESLADDVALSKQDPPPELVDVSSNDVAPTPVEPASPSEAATAQPSDDDANPDASSRPELVDISAIAPTPMEAIAPYDAATAQLNDDEADPQLRDSGRIAHGPPADDMESDGMPPAADAAHHICADANQQLTMDAEAASPPELLDISANVSPMPAEAADLDDDDDEDDHDDDDYDAAAAALSQSLLSVPPVLIEISSSAGFRNLTDYAPDPQLHIDGDAENLDVVLAMNEAYSELIDDMIEKTVLAIRQNRSMQGELADRKKVLDVNAAIVKRKVPVGQFLPPYFKDEHNMCPPQNSEAKRKMDCMIYDPLLKEEKKWSSAELRTLHAAVRSSMIDERLTPIYAQRELVQEKVREANATTTVAERLEWDEKLAALNRKIDYIKTLSDKLLLTGDYGTVDWSAIAMANFKGLRTPASLKAKWCNEQAPQWSKKDWTMDEVQRLNEMAKEKFVSWTMIATKLGTDRTPWQCFEKYKSEIASEILKREWTEEEDERLVTLVKSLQLNGVIQWDKVTYHMSGRTRQQCRTRYLRTLDKSITHGRWTDEEDLLLMCSIGRYGAKDWRKIAKGVPGRNDGQCRERWVNVLDRANRTQEWTMEEDEQLLCAVNTFGKGQWKRIASVLEGRSDRVCKSRFRALLTTKMRICSAQLSKIREAQPAQTFKPKDSKDFKKKKTRGNDKAGVHSRKATRALPKRGCRSNLRESEEALNATPRRHVGNRERRWSEMSDSELFDGPTERTHKVYVARKELSWLPVEFDDPEMTEETKRQRLTEALCQVVSKQDQLRSIAAQEEFGGRAKAGVAGELKRILEGSVNSRVLAMMDNDEDEDDDEEDEGPMTSAAAAALSARRALRARARRGMQQAAAGAAAAAAHDDMLQPTAATAHAAGVLLVELPRIAQIATPLLSCVESGEKPHSMEEVLTKIEDSLVHHKEYLQLRELMRSLLVEPLTLFFSLEDENASEASLMAQFDQARQQLMEGVEKARRERKAPVKRAHAKTGKRTTIQKKKKTRATKASAVRATRKRKMSETSSEEEPDEAPMREKRKNAWDEVSDDEITVDWEEGEGGGRRTEDEEEEEAAAKPMTRSAARNKRRALWMEEEQEDEEEEEGEQEEEEEPPVKRRPGRPRKSIVAVVDTAEAKDTVDGESDEEDREEKKTPAKRRPGRPRKSIDSSSGTMEAKDTVDGENEEIGDKKKQQKAPPAKRGRGRTRKSAQPASDAEDEEDTMEKEEEDTVEGQEEMMESQGTEDTVAAEEDEEAPEDAEPFEEEEHVSDEEEEAADAQETVEGESEDSGDELPLME